MTQTELKMRHDAFGAAREKLGEHASIEEVNALAEQIYEQKQAAIAGVSFISSRGKPQ